MNGNAMMFWLLATPSLGLTLAIALNNRWWLVSLVLLFAFMEGGLLLIAIAALIVASTIGWGP